VNGHIGFLNSRKPHFNQAYLFRGMAWLCREMS